MKIHAQAPGKAILFGEHYVVYGAPGLACAIAPENEILLWAQKPASARGSRDWSAGPIEAVPSSDASPAQPGLEYQTALGTLVVRPMAGSASDLHIEGPPALKPQAEAYRRALVAAPALARLSIQAQVSKVWPLKGVGNSASLAAALGAGLLQLGGKKPSASALFELAQAADAVAHGGVPSGIDASAVCQGGAVLYQKSMDAKAHSLKPFPLSLPKGWSFILINTLLPGEEKSTTAEQIAAFAAAHHLAQSPAQMPAKAREQLCAPYVKIFAQAQAALKKKDMKALGRCMNENQALLESGNVSTPMLDSAVRIARQAGAAGAKLSGAGGTGGLAIALVANQQKKAVEQALNSQGLRCYEFEISKKGAHAGAKK